MALIENLYVGDGSTVLYSFTFPYIEAGDVKVSLDGTNTTEYSLANATTVEFVTAPAVGVAIRIYRDTSLDDPKAVFYPGSAIRAQDLNDNFEQNLFVIQEANFNNEQSAADSAAARATAEAAEATANTANAQSAAAEASAATANANAIQAAADAAQAQADATQAASNATAAQISADQANAAVQAAAIFNPVLNVAAIPGFPADQDRVSVLDSTGIAAFTPLTGLPVGPTYDSGSYVNLVYQQAQATWEYVAYGINDPDARYLLDQADTVSTTNLASSAVTEGKIANTAVTPSKLDRSYLETDGDTMTGTLGGTDAVFSGPVTANTFVGIGASPTGSVTMFAGTTVPTGWLECNGQAAPSALAAVLGQANVPDLRGEFVRGLDSGRGVDSGRTLGSSQDASEVAYRVTTDLGGYSPFSYAGFRYQADADIVTNYEDSRVVGGSTSSPGADGPPRATQVSYAQIRPRNVAMMYIIKT